MFAPNDIGIYASSFYDKVHTYIGAFISNSIGLFLYCLK